MKKITLIVLFMGLFQLSAQNTCADALPVTVGLYTVDAINGTEQAPSNCTETSNNPGAAAEWYSYTSPVNMGVVVSTSLPQNICKDTRIQIYTGSCGGTLTCIGGDDDSGALACNVAPNNTYLSFATFNALAGQTYYIVFDNRWSSTGFDFEITEQAFTQPGVVFTTQSIPSNSVICSVADMNGDFLDDIVTVQNNQMTVLTQQVGGGFTSTIYPLPDLLTRPQWSITAGDFDRNGYNDLVFGGGSRLTVIRANDTGTGYTEVPYPQNIFTQRANFVDINNDGHLDLFACHDVDQSHAYRNDGNGNLIFDIPFFPTLDVGGNYQSLFLDYDNDGDQDMYMSKCRGGAPVGDPQRINLLYRNNGDGTFTEVAEAAGVNDGSQSWSTAAEDFDNDGDFDLLVSNISDANKFYRNNGDGTFTDIYGATGIASQVGSWEVQAADFNNDGFVDFVWQNGKELYLNNGDLTFSAYDLPFSEGGIGDFNNDGFLDFQYGSQLYINTPNQNNWLKVNMQGVQSNRNGIGARVEITGAWGTQIREMRSGSGFSHQSSMNLHFGLGAEDVITQMKVTWPSGIVDIFDNVPSNATFMAVEGVTLGVNDNQISNFSIFPNPAKDRITLSANSGTSQEYEIQVYSITGKLIGVFEKTNTVDVQSFAKGTYLLVAKDSSGKMATQKFIKE